MSTPPSRLRRTPNASPADDRSVAVTPRRRLAALNRLRHLKMARSAHAFVRGSTPYFYERLKTTLGNAIPDAPPLWICGDCHVGNLGPIGSLDGEVDMEIRDLDQGVIGHPAHDLIRLGLSLATSIRSSDLPGVTVAHMIECLVMGYAQGLRHPNGDRGHHRPETVHVALQSALHRRWKHLARERMEQLDPSFPIGPRFWPITRSEAAAIDALCSETAIARLITAVSKRDDDARIRVVDRAYWVKGCSSLGLMRFAVLLRIGRKSDGPLQHCLLDIKEATTPLSSQAQHAAMPRDPAQRVAEAARHLSPHLGERLVPTTLLGRPVFVRELYPQDLKLDLDLLPRREVGDIAFYLGAVIGAAHGRQLTVADRRVWALRLQSQRSRKLDAPSWLWTSVVDLTALHEAAYLRHCHQFRSDRLDNLPGG